MILTTHRSGSTLLSRLLDAHPEIMCLGEVFSPGSEYHLPALPGNATYRDWLPHRGVLEAVYGGAIRRADADKSAPTAPVIGFKQMYHYLGASVRDALPDWVEANGVTVIHLVRRNRFEQFLSYRTMKSTGRAHYKPHEAKHPNTTAPLDFDQAVLTDMASRIRVLEREFDLFSRQLQPSQRSIQYLEIAYEQLTDARLGPRLLRAILALLGVADVDYPLSVQMMPTRKVSDGSPCHKRVTNPDDVYVALTRIHPLSLELCRWPASA